MQIKNNKGMALVAAILMMVVLGVLGVSMVVLTTGETSKEVKSRLGTSALYVADAGIEKAICNIKKSKYSDFTVYVGIGTGDKEGEAVVDITSLGDKKYQIDSTGYVPSQSDIKEERSIRVKVNASAGYPDYSAISGETGSFSSNVDVYGVVFSNDLIIIQSNVHFYPDNNGDVAIYTASDSTLLTDDLDSAIEIDSNFYFDEDNEATGTREIRAQGVIDGNEDSDPNGDNFKSSPKPTIVENDDSDKTEELDSDEVQFVDTDNLIENADETDYTFGGKGTDVGNGRIEFSSDETLNLNGNVYYYDNGVEFDSNIVLAGSGTFVVDGAAGDSSNWDNGIIITSNINGEGDGYAKANFIVAGGDWIAEDIDIESNVELNGIIQAARDIKVNSNVDILGIVAAGEELKADSNIEFNYSDDVFDVPLNESDENEDINVISWEEK